MLNRQGRFAAALRPRSAFGRGVTMLAGGSAFAQLLSVAVAPLLTRLFSPEDFGVLAIYTTIISIVGVIASGQYHQAIPLPNDDFTAANLFSLSLALVLGIALASALVVIPYGMPIANFLGAPALGPYMWLVPLGILGVATYEVASTYAIRKKSFGLIARTRITQGVGQSGVQVITGLSGAGAIGLLAGQLIGQTVGSLALATAALRGDREAFRHVRFAAMADAALRYKRFPVFWSWAVIFNALGVQAPVLLIAYFFGGAVAGLFALAQRVAMMPVMLIAKSSSQVFFSIASEANRSNKLGAVAGNLFHKMFCAALPFLPIVVLAAPDLVEVIFGSTWRESGVFIQWLAPWLFILFLAFPLTPVVKVLERQRGELLFQAVLLVGRAGSIVTGGLLGDARIAIALFGTISGLLWLGYLAWMLRIAGARWCHGLRGIVKPAGLSLSIALFLGYIASNTQGDSATIAGVLACTVIAVFAARRSFSADPNSAQKDT